jgi:2-dehydropantoate 2-reductase
MMRVTIFGAGALGSVIGGLMAESHKVSLVCRNDHAMAINADGLWIDGMTERRAFPYASVDTQGMPIQDVVIVTVKSYDTREALVSIDPLLGEGTSLVILQNGLTVLRDVKELHPGALVATASLGAQYIGPGHVRLTGQGEVVVGDPDDDMDLCEKVLESFRSTGIAIQCSPDMKREVWKKAVISSCINPLTAITRKRNAVIVNDQEINDLARSCFEESFRVGTASGNLDLDDIGFADVERVASATATNRSSMLQDVDRGRRTEIDSINGEIVRIGSGLGLDVRVNHILASIVSAMTRRPDPSDDL